MTSRTAFRRPQPTVTLCVASAGPPARTRALLEHVRPHVDEIVLAVDAGAGRDTLERCADLADRRLSFTQENPSSASLWGWLFEQASAEWVLRMDDDELPSRALLEALPDLVADVRLSQYRLRRRWLWPDPSHVIAEPPWSIEYIPRLTRTVHGLVAYAGGMHSDESAIGEVRMVDAAFYHADLLENSAGDRRRKALLNERLSPGLVFAGGSVNVPYIPEAAGDLRTEAIPAPDEAAVQAFLSADGADTVPGGEALGPEETATPGDLRRPILARPVSPGTYAAAIELRDPPGEVRAGTLHHILVSVRNEGDERWPAGDRPERPIRLGYRWKRGPKGPVVFDGRGIFLETVLPGTTVHHHLALEAPPEPGAYLLEVDLVHEHVRWFDATVSRDVTVTPPPAPVEPLLGLPIASGELEELARLRAELAELRRTAPEPPGRVVEQDRRPDLDEPAVHRLRADRMISDLQAQVGRLEAEALRMGSSSLGADPGSDGDSPPG